MCDIQSYFRKGLILPGLRHPEDYCCKAAGSGGGGRGSTHRKKMDRRHGSQETAMENTLQTCRGSIPPTRSDATHICIHGASGRGITTMGSTADGASRLDLYGASNITGGYQAMRETRGKR